MTSFNIQNKALALSQKKALQTKCLQGFFKFYGAKNETRTRDPDLGKVVLYQLSYSRI